MSRTFAKGTRAWGICQRSGLRFLLKDLVPDGRYPNLMVNPAWWEPKHPQENPITVTDPQTLYRPAPERFADPNHGVPAPDISTLVPQ